MTARTAYGVSAILRNTKQTSWTQPSRDNSTAAWLISREFVS